MTGSLLLNNVDVVNADGMLADTSILIDDGKVSSTGSNLSVSSTVSHYDFSNSSERIYALPGFIDLHIHGIDGADVMDATASALQTMTTALAKQGTTGFLATTMTAANADVEQALANIASFANDDGAEILGVHLEGPFLHCSAAGAQDAHHMQKPDYELFCRWQEIANDMIKLVTVAAEYEESLDFIAKCHAANVVVSIGHTQATADITAAAIKAGATYATHLFNAMSGLHHRDSGAAFPLLMSDKVTAELIADGFHISPWAAKLAWRIKQASKLVLVSDSMRARCMGAGQYTLGEGDVTVDADGKATLADGTLAGSILDQLSAAKWMQVNVGCKLQQLVQMCATNPANLLGLSNRKGKIAAGYDADIVLVKENLEWINTICRGKLIQPL